MRRRLLADCDMPHHRPEVMADAGGCLITRLSRPCSQARQTLGGRSHENTHFRRGYWGRCAECTRALGDAKIRRRRFQERICHDQIVGVRMLRNPCGDCFCVRGVGDTSRWDPRRRVGRSRHCGWGLSRRAARQVPWRLSCGRLEGTTVLARWAPVWIWARARSIRRSLLRVWLQRLSSLRL